MSVAKVVEITAESDQSFEDAIQKGISKASQTVQNIRSAWVKGQQVIVENGRVTRYRVILKITFILN